MSFNIEKLEVVNVLEPRININNKREYAVLRGGSQVSWKNVISTSYSNSSAQFSAPPPSPFIIVDRKVYYKQPVTITFAGTGSGTDNLLQSGFDAFRAFPLSQIINTLQVTINNTSVSINLSDVISALLRFHTPQKLRELDYSLTPSMLDQAQNYNDLVNTNRNPLAPYGDGFEMARGGFIYDAFTNTNTAATITATLCEPIFLSPFYFGHGNESGFIGVQNMDFNFTFNQDLTRLWSHAAASGATINSITVTLGQPSLLFTYITPPILEPIPKDATYPYFEVNRYPTVYGNALNSNASAVISSSNIQLNTIPRRMYIFARLANASQTYQTTDTFLAINQISINWNNYAGLMSSADQRSLFNISRKNGCDLSWEQWSGVSDTFLGTTNTSIGLIGSVLCVEFGTDIGLEPQEAPGNLGTYQLQMDVTVTNINQTVNYTANQVALYVVVVNEGVFNILDNRSVSQIGVLTGNDILDAKKQDYVDYRDVEHVYGSGNFFSNLKNYGKKIYSIAKRVVPIARKIAHYVPGISQYADVGKDILGFGKKKMHKKKVHRKRGAGINEDYDYDDEYDNDDDNDFSGGQIISRNELSNRLNNY